MLFQDLKEGEYFAKNGIFQKCGKIMAKDLDGKRWRFGVTDQVRKLHPKYSYQYDAYYVEGQWLEGCDCCPDRPEKPYDGIF